VREREREKERDRIRVGWMESNSMNNNPSVAKRWIITMLLLKDGVMEKCVTVSLKMTSIKEISFYAREVCYHAYNGIM